MYDTFLVLSEMPWLYKPTLKCQRESKKVLQAQNFSLILFFVCVLIFNLKIKPTMIKNMKIEMNQMLIPTSSAPE